MKKLTIILALASIAPMLSACEYRSTTTNPPVIERHTTVVQPGTTVVTPAVNCPNGYDASTNSCY